MTSRAEQGGVSGADCPPGPSTVPSLPVILRTRHVLPPGCSLQTAGLTSPIHGSHGSHAAQPPSQVTGASRGGSARRCMGMRTSGSKPRRSGAGAARARADPTWASLRGAAQLSRAIAAVGPADPEVPGDRPPWAPLPSCRTRWRSYHCTHLRACCTVGLHPETLPSTSEEQDLGSQELGFPLGLLKKVCGCASLPRLTGLAAPPAPSPSSRVM